MAATASTMMPLGTPAPDFALSDTEGKTVKRDDFAGKPLLVMFICNHCPFVKLVADQLKKLGDDCAGKLGIVAIMSNDVANYPGDSPDKMKQEKASRGYNFPYLYDETQEVAKAYGAACTPDFFLFDADHKLAYRGQLDDARPSSPQPVTGADLRAAIDAVLVGNKPSDKQLPSLGCNIKWKTGNQPAYFNA